MAENVIDVHNHVIPTEVLDFELNHQACGVSHDGGTWRGPNAPSFAIGATFYDPKAKLANLAEHGISAAMVSAPPSHLRYDLASGLAADYFAAMNTGLARFCDAAADRLWWLASVPLQDVELARQAYQEALREGCSGAAIGTSIAGRRLDEEEFDPFWGDVASAGKPVLIHPAFNEPHGSLSAYYFQNVIGNPLETTLTVERLIAAGTFDRHPSLRLILVHAGGYLPYQLGRLRHAITVRPELAHLDGADPWRYLDNLMFDTITHDEQALSYLVSRVGAARVLLGTDMPFDMGMPQGACTARTALAEADREAVLSGNAIRAFGLEAALSGESA